MHSQWQDFLGARGAVIKQGRVASFGQPPQELQAAAQDTIIADLSHLGLLEVQGDDAVAFLQGQVTNDVKLLDGSNSHYSGYCTAKGRLLAIFLAYAHRDHLHLQLNGALTASILKRLKMYVLRSKVTLTDLSDDVIRIGIAGPQATAALEESLGAVPQEAYALLDLEGTTLLRLPGDMPRYEIFCPPEDAPTLWDQLRTHTTPVGADCWEWLELRAGVPDVEPTTSEAFVPQMVNLDLLNGINFKKGCYTGQEIVARTHYLGKVKRRTLLAHMDGVQAPQPGDLVFGSDTAEAVGQIVRAATAPSGGYDALVEARSESVVAGTLRWGTSDGPALQPLPLPYAVE